uniref:Cyclin-like domain-containing protein n=1 Tax=Amorphochlora amoebiformis TaxID=1561963 RepID=A0A7S0CRS5_9EUKA
MEQMSIATASVYFHRLYCRYSFKDYDRELVACTCLFLAGKTEETRKKLDDVVDHFNYVIHCRVKGKTKRPSKSSQEFKQFRAKVIEMEAVLMEALEFKFYVAHPYPLLISNLRKLFPDKDGVHGKDLGGQKGLAQLAWFFVNDSLRTTLCLTHPPQKIALAAIYLALKNKRFDYDKEFKREGKPWCEDFNSSENEVKGIAESILDAYSKEQKARETHKPKKKVKLTPEELEIYKKLSSDEKRDFLIRIQRKNEDRKKEYAKRKHHHHHQRQPIKRHKPSRTSSQTAGAGLGTSSTRPAGSTASLQLSKPPPSIPKSPRSHSNHQPPTQPMHNTVNPSAATNHTTDQKQNGIPPSSNYTGVPTHTSGPIPPTENKNSIPLTSTNSATAKPIAKPSESTGGHVDRNGKSGPSASEAKAVSVD